MHSSETTQSEQSLSVGDLARRTGVAATTLRSWEARFGFPEPTRLTGGHRRYDGRQAALVTEVARLRGAGLSMPQAIAAAKAAAAPLPNSFFASLRDGERGLRSHLLGKRALRALTSAVEDECLARAERPVLFGAFQQERFYRQSEERWRELARTAERTVVFADFEAGRAPSDLPVETPLPTGSPVGREWVMVCDSPGLSACVAGWEHPSRLGTLDQERTFETLWSLDPVTVRDATRVGIGLVRATDPDLADTLTGSLAEVAGPGSTDLRRATSLFARILDYSQRAPDGPDGPDLAS